MVDAYLKEGREAGNRLMKQPGEGFDAITDSIATQVAGALEQQQQQLMGQERRSPAKLAPCKSQDLLLLVVSLTIIMLMCC